MKKAFATLGIVEIFTDHFDRNSAAELQIQRLEDPPHSALAELSFDAIPFLQLRSDHALL